MINNELIAYIFIVAGISLDIIGCIGLIRLPDFYSRLQVTTKSVTFGTFLMLFGVFILKGLSPTGIKALLTAIFLLITSPAAAHALARGAHISGAGLSKGAVCDKYNDDKKFSNTTS